MAHEVDDHQVLGAVLRGLGEGAGEGAVAGRLAPRGRVPLIGRLSTPPPPAEAQEALGERGADRKLGEGEPGGERSRVPRPERAVQPPGIAAEGQLDAVGEARL